MTDDQAAGWRDIAPELTDKQIQYIDKLERRHGPREALLLAVAREYAQSNLAEKVFIGDVPEPAGATFVGGWEHAETGEWYREFDGAAWSAGPVRVAICGRQSSHGEVELRVSVCGTDDAGSELGAEELRRLIVVLREAENSIKTSSDRRPRQESNLRPRD